MWKLVRMKAGQFPHFFEHLSEWWLGIFLLVSKMNQTVGHFPPICENLSLWQWDIFFLFVKTCQNDCGTIFSFLSSFVWMTMGHFLPFSHSDNFSQNSLLYFQNGYFSKILWCCHEPHNKVIGMQLKVK